MRSHVATDVCHFASERGDYLDFGEWQAERGRRRALRRIELYAALLAGRAVVQTWPGAAADFRPSVFGAFPTSPAPDTPDGPLEDRVFPRGVPLGEPRARYLAIHCEARENDWGLATRII